MLDLLLICVGLFICFGGIYFQRIIAGINGFIWGVILGLIIVVSSYISTYGTWALTYGMDENYLLVVLLIGVVSCILSVVLQRIITAVQVFGTVMEIALILALGVEDAAGILFIALCVAVGLAILCYRFYDYAIIICTAFSGGFIASIGFVSAMKGMWDAEILGYIIMGQTSDEPGAILGITLILGCIGCVVQQRRLDARAAAQTGEDGTEKQEKLQQFDTGSHTQEQYNVRSNTMGTVGMGQALKETGHDIKKAIVEMTTAQGRVEVKRQIIHNKLCFAALLLWIVGTFMVSKVYLDILWEVIEIVWLLALVGLAWLVMYEDVKCQIVFECLFAIGNILCFFQVISFDPWRLFKMALALFVIGCCLIFINKIIPELKCKLIVLSVLAEVLSLVYDDIITYMVGIQLDMLWERYIKYLILTAGASFIVYEINKVAGRNTGTHGNMSKQNTDAFVHVSLAENKKQTIGHTGTPVLQCPKCHQTYAPGMAFCTKCGQKLVTVYKDNVAGK